MAAVTYGTVVEADTYGLGASVISCALYATGCRKFFVADLDKALALGHDLPGQFTAFAPNGSVASMADEYRVPASPQF